MVNRYWLGKKRTLEDRIKMSLSKIGKPLSAEHKEKIRLKSLGNKSRTGQHLSEATKGKMSEQRRGERHWNWKGGIAKENTKIRLGAKYKMWRGAVYSRDEYTDQKYGEKERGLVAHHIQNFSSHPELRFSVENGVTFSIKAHNEFHRRYGNKNNTWEQMNEFILEELLKNK